MKRFVDTDWRLILVTGALFAANLIAYAPGKLGNASRAQLSQAMTGQFFDWYPPIMAVLWSGLLHLSSGPFPMLVVQLGMYWFGFGLIADALHRTGRRYAAWIVVASAAFPVFLFYSRVVNKDVAMAASLLASFSILFWFRVQGRVVPKPLLAVSLIFLGYGTLVRWNAIFAFGPLLIYALGATPRSSVRIICASVILAILAWPASTFVNHTLLKAVSVTPAQSLQVFDLMGIDKHRRGAPHLAPFGISAADVDRCYTSFASDTMHSWGICGSERTKLGLAPAAEPRTPLAPTVKDQLSQLWRHAILQEPLAYAWHRLTYFNSSLYFLVPAKHFRFSKDRAFAAADGRPSAAYRAANSKRALLMDYLKRPFPFWPITWLAVALVLLTTRVQSSTDDASEYASAILATSGLMYGGGYLIVGAATEVRYYYWSVMAILLATIISLPRLLALLRTPTTRSRVVFGGLIGVVAAGYVFRIFDITVLVR